MLLAQLELNEATEVDFGIEIHGTTEKTSDIRFIIEGPKYGIVCKCTESAGTITASIPKLKGILPAGQFEARLEVIIDGKFFMPLQESIEFKPLVEFDLKSAIARPSIQTHVQTTAVKIRVLEDPEKKENMKAKEFTPVEKDETDEESTSDNDNQDTSDAKPAETPSTVATPSKKAEGTSEGDKPAMTWDQIAKKSMTNPKNAPKVEKGDFDYENVKGASPELKASSKSAGTDTATTGLPKAAVDYNPGKSTGAQTTKQPTKQPAAGMSKEDRAKSVLSKMTEIKAKMAGLKGKQPQR